MALQYTLEIETSFDDESTIYDESSTIVESSNKEEDEEVILSVVVIQTQIENCEDEEPSNINKTSDIPPPDKNKWHGIMVEIKNGDTKSSYTPGDQALVDGYSDLRKKYKQSKKAVKDRFFKKITTMVHHLYTHY